jgi:hypothetical protein
MTSSHPFFAAEDKKKDEKKEDKIAPPSRFIDEKISDESGTETKSDSALKPAGLKNPFWK